MKIYPEHGHAIGYCSKGMRKMAARHGWDWLDIVKNGIDEETLLATGDAMAIKLVESVKNGQQQQRNSRV